MGDRRGDVTDHLRVRAVEICRGRLEELVVRGIRNRGPMDGEWRVTGDCAWRADQRSVWSCACRRVLANGERRRGRGDGGAVGEDGFNEPVDIARRHTRRQFVRSRRADDARILIISRRPHSVAGRFWYRRPNEMDRGDERIPEDWGR